jgi:Tfp pilus assembly protein PilO
MQGVPKNRIRAIDACALSGTLGVVVLVGYVTLGSSLASIRDLAAERQALTVRLNYLTEVADKVGQGEEELDRLAEQMGQLTHRLPDTIDFASFYGEFTDLAAIHHVEVADLAPGDVSTKHDYVKMPVTLKAEATLDDFHAFLFAVTGLERLVKVEVLGIGASGRPHFCSIDMTVSIYALNEKATGNGE